MKEQISPETICELLNSGEFFGMSASVPASLYHGSKHYLGSTGLNTFRKQSPAHFKAYENAELPETPALLMGRALHSMILEPELDAVVGEPKVDKRTKSGKEESEAFLKANVGKIILPESMYQDACYIRNRVLGHPTVKKLLREGQSEVSAFTKCPYTGVKVKARADRLLLDKRVILDFKSTADASPAAFARSIASFGYVHSAAHYLDTFSYVLGEDLRGFVLVAFEKTAPFEVAVYELDSSDLQMARGQNRQALSRFKECQEKNEWPGYSARIEKLRAPTWAFTGDES